VTHLNKATRHQLARKAADGSPAAALVSAQHELAAAQQTQALKERRDMISLRPNVHAIDIDAASSGPWTITDLNGNEDGAWLIEAAGYIFNTGGTSNRDLTITLPQAGLTGLLYGNERRRWWNDNGVITNEAPGAGIGTGLMLATTDFSADGHFIATARLQTWRTAGVQRLVYQAQHSFSAYNTARRIQYETLGTVVETSISNLTEIRFNILAPAQLRQTRIRVRPLAG
jgi:hypothetical protein